MSSTRTWFSAFLLAFLTLQGLQGFCTNTGNNAAAVVSFPDLYEASIAELQAGLDAEHFTSVDLVKVRPSAQPHSSRY